MPSSAGAGSTLNPPENNSAIMVWGFETLATSTRLRVMRRDIDLLILFERIRSWPAARQRAACFSLRKIIFSALAEIENLKYFLQCCYSACRRRGLVGI